MGRIFSCIIFMLVIFTAGCANLQQTPSKVEINSQLARLDSCEKFYHALDESVLAENVRDVQTASIKGSRFLDVNRFLISYKDEVKQTDKQNFWLEIAAGLNRQKRELEWANLSVSTKNTIQQRFLRQSSFEKRLLSCSKEYLKRLTASEKSTLIQQAEVDDDYSTAMRVLGIYPLSSMMVKNKIDKQHAATRKIFNTPLSQLSIEGKLQRYVPDYNSLTFDGSIKRENALGIPFIPTTVLNELFERYAPVLEINETSDADKIGKIALNDSNSPFVNTNQPAVYTLLSYTRFNDKTLAQLNYVFWFPERPAEKSMDIYAGKFDSITWRVTLDENLQPVVFDSVHSCGCYHKFYSTKGLAFNLTAALKEKEPPFLAQHNLLVDSNKPWVIRISSGSHYIQRAYQQKRFDHAAKFYNVMNYDQLRSLNGKKLNRNLFASNGILLESKRPERFLLWPMGIPSAGAMRQWGHHAIAFLGKRYFDEPYLLDKYFKPETTQ